MGAASRGTSQTVAAVAHHNQTARKQPSGSVFQAITHVTLIDPGMGADEREDMTILIRDSKIVAVQKSSEARLAPGTLVHDERGRYVIPGLWDAHVHLTQVGPKAFPLLLANGYMPSTDRTGSSSPLRRPRAAVDA